MMTAQSALERNRELADRINRDVRQNPGSPYAGKFVGIVDGQVWVVTETLRETGQTSRLRN